jgi:hypothetical protein
MGGVKAIVTNLRQRDGKQVFDVAFTSPIYAVGNAKLEVFIPAEGVTEGQELDFVAEGYEVSGNT